MVMVDDSPHCWVATLEHMEEPATEPCRVTTPGTVIEVQPLFGGALVPVMVTVV